mgnify:CR=1 FL=1
MYTFKCPAILLAKNKYTQTNIIFENSSQVMNVKPDSIYVYWRKKTGIS